MERNIKNISKKNNYLEINPIDIIAVPIKDILGAYISDKFPTLIDCQNFLKRLLKKAFHNLMYERGLDKKEISDDKCFFYKRGSLLKNQAIVKFNHKIRFKKLVGKYHDNFWHYGISTRVRLSPFPCYSLKAHILFSNDGYDIWTDDSKLRLARRSKGKHWFNEQWRDQLLAFIASLGKGKNKISIRLENDYYLEMPLLTMQFYSDIGYFEPENKARLDVLYTIEESQDELMEITHDYEGEQSNSDDIQND